MSDAPYGSFLRYDDSVLYQYKIILSELDSETDCGEQCAAVLFYIFHLVALF